MERRRFPADGYRMCRQAELAATALLDRDSERFERRSRVPETRGLDREVVDPDVRFCSVIRPTATPTSHYMPLNTTILALYPGQRQTLS